MQLWLMWIFPVQCFNWNDCFQLNVDLGDEKRTALHTAAIGGHSEVVQFLLSRRADINIPDSDNDRPIHNCVHGLVSSFIYCTVDINIPDSDNDRPIHNCVHGLVSLSVVL